MKHGNYSNAETHLRSFLASNPDSAEGHFMLGYVFYREQKPRDSLAQYTAGARRRRPAANDLAIVAMDYILLRDYPDADKWLTLATNWKPKNALYWYYLGRTKYNEDRFQDAIEAFKRCLSVHPGDIRAEYNLGLAYAGLNRSDDAIAAYKNAIQWEMHQAKTDPEPYFDLGQMLLNQGHYNRATSYLEHASALDANNPRFHEVLGRAYERLGKLKLADAEMNKAISLAPNVSSLHFEMGRIYHKEGFAAKASEEFARCSALDGAHSTEEAETPNPAPHD